MITQANSIPQRLPQSTVSNSQRVPVSTENALKGRRQSVSSTNSIVEKRTTTNQQLDAHCMSDIPPFTDGESNPPTPKSTISTTRDRATQDTPSKDSSAQPKSQPDLISHSMTSATSPSQGIPSIINIGATGNRVHDVLQMPRSPITVASDTSSSTDDRDAIFSPVASRTYNKSAYSAFSSSSSASSAKDIIAQLKTTVQIPARSAKWDKLLSVIEKKQRDGEVTIGCSVNPT
jgi:hypothetical protein